MLSRVCQHSAETPTRIRRAFAENREHTRAQIAEMARTAWRELDAKMEAASRLAQEPVHDIEHLIESVAEKLRFPERLVQEIREALGGNLCRCGTYPQHPKAILEAADILRQ